MRIFKEAFSNNKTWPILFIVIGFAMFLPQLLLGIQYTHDISFHLTWFLSYKEALTHGIFYPRWLPDQLNGLGSPALFFYPPFTTVFYIAIDFLSGHMLPANRVMGIAAFLMSALSGYTFYLWVKKYAIINYSVIAAIFYAIAPYHLNINLYVRGAMAEYAAYIWIPLIFLGIRDFIFEKTIKSAFFLVVGLIGIFLTHLLTAMVIAPIALMYLIICLVSQYETSKKVEASRVFMLVMFSLLAIAVAAFYFIPAVGLLTDTNSIALYRDVSKTTLFSGLDNVENRFGMRLLVFASIYFSLFIYFLIELLIQCKKEGSLPRNSAPTILWIGTGLIFYSLMCGGFSFIFRSPSPYAQIQFPWRLLGMVEFALASLAVYSVATCKSQAARGRMVKICLVTLVCLTSYQLRDVAIKSYYNFKTSTPILDYRDVRLMLSPLEYFPIGTNISKSADKTIEQFNDYALSKVPAFIDIVDGDIVQASRNGSVFSIRSVAKRETQVTIQQFYFPGWVAVDESGQELQVFPSADGRLVSYRISAGDHKVVLSRILTEQEKWGNNIALAAAIALLSCLLLALLGHRNVKKKRVI